MKKTFLFLLALVASISGAWAQETNFALNKDAYASSYYAAENNYVANANDGNEGTLWANNRGEATVGNPQDVTNPYWYVDLGENTTFNTIEIVFNGNQRPTAAQIVTGTGDTPANPTWSGTPIVTIASTPDIPVTYNFESQNARYIKISATAFNDAYGIGIKEFRVFNRVPAHFASVSVSPVMFAVGTEQTVTASTLDQFGTAYAGTFTYAVSPSDGVTNNNDGTFTFATTAVAGTYTISATEEGGNTYSAKVYSVDAPVPPTDDLSDVLPVFSKTYSVESPSISDPSWNGKYGTATKINLSSDNTSYLVTNCGEFGFNLGGADVTAFKSLHALVFSAQDYDGNVSHGNEGTLGIMKLKAGQWNDVQINVKDNTITSFGWLFFRPGIAGSSTNTIIITDVYFSKNEPVIPFEISSSGVVTGDVTESNVAAINANVSSVINLVNANVKETISLTPSNSNAVVVVGGTARTPNASGANVTASNLVVFDNTYYRAASGHVITINDANASQPDYGFTIDAKDDGYVITRTLPAKKYVTTCLPAGVATGDLTGIDVYDLTSATGSSLTFTKKETAVINANTPYVLYSESGATLTTGTVKSDLNLNQNAVGSTTVDEATFVGTFKPVAGDGSMYALQGGEVRPFAAGATIGAFRAYFTSMPAGAHEFNVIFNDNEGTTGIGRLVNGEFEVEKGAFYNLNGQRVQNPTKGLYIVNGKKVIIK